MTEEYRMMVIQENGMAYETRIRDDLDVFEQVIGCECVDMVARTIKGVKYHFIVDDCGRLKEREITAIHSLKMIEPILVGTLIITKLDRQGEHFMDLTDKDVERISSNIADIDGCPVLFGIDFPRPPRWPELIG